MRRPIALKMLMAIVSVGTLITATIVLNNRNRPMNEAPFVPSRPVKAVFDDAARKRFPVAKADLLSQVADQDHDSVKTSLSREMMISKLISEALDHRPHLLSQAKDQVAARMPEILRLRQTTDGQTSEALLIVADTLSCRSAYEQDMTVTINLERLFDAYCVDPYFDYPGGFGAKAAVEVTILPLSTLSQWEGLDNDYDRLVKTELRRLVVQDFAQHYTSTGSLTYAP